MNKQKIRGFLAACLSLGAAIASADYPLTVHASEAIAQIEPHDEHDNQVSLPSLDVSLLARFKCPLDTEADSVTVSVADSHKRYGPEDIVDTEILEVSFSVPANQIAPVALTDFCISGKPIDDESLLLPGVATAQVSLNCRNQTGASVFFASAALPLRLSCKGGENQVSSTDK